MRGVEGGQDAWVGRTVGSSLRSTGVWEDGGLREYRLDMLAGSSLKRTGVWEDGSWTGLNK